MSKSTLESILAKGTVKACLAFFENLSEKERQQYSMQAAAALKDAEDQSWKKTKVGGLTGMTYTASPRLPVCKVAVWAACPFGTIKRLSWRAIPDDEEDAYRIIVARQPDWLSDWAEWVCEARPGQWRLVRRLVKEGRCRKPQGEGYALGMITNLCPYHEGATTIYRALLEDSDLLREDIWRLFEVEGNMSSSLAARDKYAKRPENTWASALLRLAKEKKVPRKRLLDASLDALARDFGAFQAGWFSRFHEALEPTPSERAERAAVYAGLLASRVGPTVSFSLKALLLLTKNDLIELKPLLASITPALTNRHKGTVQSALQLLEVISKQNPQLHAQVGVLLAEALLHTSPDIHKKAIDVLARGKARISKDLADVLRERMDHVAASQRGRLQALLASEAPVQQATDQAPPGLDERELRQRAAALPQKWRRLTAVDRLLASLDSGQADVPGMDLDPSDIPRLDPAKRLTPIESVDELIDVCAQVLENPDNTTDLERAFDGISRLCSERPSDFDARTGPLRKRARDRMAQIHAAPFMGYGPLVDLCGLVIAWLSRELLMAKKTGIYQYGKNVDVFQLDVGKRPIQLYVSRYPTVARYQSQRVYEIAQRCVANHAAPLLAAPTHQGGWIEPAALVERALARQKLAVPADRLDQIQALLRLAPDGRPVARKAAAKVQGESGQALRYALGCEETVGADAPLWIAAARARNPFGNDDKLLQAHPGLGPNAGETAVYEPKVRPIPEDAFHRKQLRVSVRPVWPKSVGIDAITVLLTPRERADSWWHNEWRKSAQELHWMLLIWPMQREAWFGAWAQTYAGNLDWWEAAWGHRVLLEPLLDPDVPLGPLARLMLALGLAAKESGESSLATDALIAAIDDGRFDAQLFGETVAFLLPMLTMARLARTFSQAARVSALHRHLVSRAAQACLRGNPAAAPRDSWALLELLKESLIEGGECLTDADARAFLEKLKGRGKTGRLVRDLLGLESNPERADAKQIVLQALGNRIQRAEAFGVARD